MTPPPLRVCLVAGEVSGDRLGAALMRALSARTGGAIVFSGVGGREMAAEGLVSPFPLGDLAVIGFMSIPARLKTILQRIRQTADAAIAARPDILVVIDSPEFTHRVAKRVRARAPTIPIVDYVSPSVWAWRPWRARAMRRYIDRVLALLPFEPDIHARLGGPPCVFVGHPVTDRVGALRPDPAEARRREMSPPVLLVMPGSRGSELARMLPVFRDTVRAVRDRFGPLDVVVPAVPHLAERVRTAVSAWPVPARVVTEAAEKDAAFRTARAALAAVRYGNAGTGGGRGADRCRLQGSLDRGTRRSVSRAGAVVHPCQPRPWRARGAGIRPARLHAGATGFRLAAFAARQSRAAGAASRFRPARCDHGNRNGVAGRTRCRGRPRYGRKT